MNRIACTICTVCVRDEPCIGRSDVMRRSASPPLLFSTAWHDDAGRDVTFPSEAPPPPPPLVVPPPPLLLFEPPPQPAATIASATVTTAANRSRFFTLPPVD